MSDEVRVLLVRHSQSEWNAAGRWQGQADPPLSELGRTQAREAARALGAVDAIWSSDLQRASETALIIAHDLGVGPVVIEPDLRERDAGGYTGLTRDQIEEHFPGYLAERRQPPGWEPQEALVARALRALRRIADEVPGGEVVVITHGGIIYAIEGHLGVEHQRIANTGARWVTVTPGDRVPMRLGERLLLSDPGDATVPAQL